MEQKYQYLDIVLELLKGEAHVREIARSLATNHMNVSRFIKSLSKQNVVDFRNIGKSKVCFLKKTSEARAYIFLAENYKILKTFSKYPTLRIIIEEIQLNEKIRFAILFGSYAKGLAKKDSDIDIYIDTNDRKIKEDLEKEDSRLSVKIGAFDRENLLVKEIIKNHVILKGVEEFYGKTKFFS